MLYIFQAYFKGGLCSEQTQKVKKNKNDITCRPMRIITFQTHCKPYLFKF